MLKGERPVELGILDPGAGHVAEIAPRAGLGVQAGTPRQRLERDAVALPWPRAIGGAALPARGSWSRCPS
jgi:hypothetical protein